MQQMNMKIGRKFILMEKQMDNHNDNSDLVEQLKDYKEKTTALLKECKRDNLIQAKEIDRLNEYIQILEMEQKK